MIIGDNRGAVIENIKKSAEAGDFYAKVELIGMSADEVDYELEYGSEL